MTKENKWCIYKHTLLLECESKGKSYIGLTKYSTKERWKNGNGYKDQAFGAAIQKYGWENFSHEIIEDNIKTLEEACEREIYWISYYHTYVHDEAAWGYNVTLGGNATCGYKFTDEQKQKISESKRGKPAWNSGKQYSEEQKKNMYKKHKPLTEEHKIKISEHNAKAMLGKHHTKETKKKISDKLIGRESTFLGHKHTEEAKEKNRLAHLGKPSAFKNKHHTVETKLKLSETKNKVKVKVQCVETGIIYESLIDAYKQTGCSRNQIRDCCKDSTKTVKGYHWRYIENDKD